MILFVFIIGVLTTLFTFYVIIQHEDKQPKNKVHFYVARDKDDALWLYLGKPIRYNDEFRSNIHSGPIARSFKFKYLGLNINDYKDLKWEDEPVEVFLNMEKL